MLWGIQAALAVWGAFFIRASSFRIGGKRFFCLFDDAMITMTYARNLMAGKGLVWTAGEPVEGFSHPLWLVLMLPANLPAIPLRLRSLVVQAASLALLVLLVWAVRRVVTTSFTRPGSPAWALAALPTAFYFPLLYWSLMGLEVALVTLFMVLGIHLALTITERGEDRLIALWVLCAAACVLRMDLVLLAAVLQSWVLLRRLDVPRFWRRWLTGAGVAAAIGVALLTLRLLYFHDWLPNTYYLKLTGVPLDVRVWRGAAALWGFARLHAPLLLLVPVAAVVGRRHRHLWLPCAIVMVYLAYDVWIGGDAWELSHQDVDVRANRFLAPVVPLLFMLLAALADLAAARWRLRRGSWARAGRVDFAIILMLTVAVANGLSLDAAGEARWRQLIVRTTPPNVERNRGMVRRVAGLQSLLRQGATVATVWAGIPAFFSDYRMVDILGYNDRQVARLPSAVPLDRAHWRDYVPGHVKWDERRLLEEQRPDAFFQVWGIRQAGGRDLLVAHGYRKVRRFWVRQDSPFLTPLATRRAATRLATARRDR